MKNKFLLLGKEEGLQNEKLESLKETARKKFNINTVRKFYGTDKNDIVLFINALSEISLFGDNDMLIMYYADLITGENAKAIVKAIKDESNDRFVILVSAENKLTNAELDKAFSKEERFVFYELFENQKIPFIRTEAKQYGLTINDETASLLLAITEPTTAELKKAIVDLASYIKIQNLPSAITKEIVYDHLSHSKDESGFTLVFHLSRKNKENAIIALTNMMNESGWNPQSLFPSLIFSLIRVESAAINKEKGLYGDAVFNIIGANGESTIIRSPSEKDTINNFLKNYTRKDISRIIKLVLKTEMEVRENDISLHSIILTKMIMDI